MSNHETSNLETSNLESLAKMSQLVVCKRVSLYNFFLLKYNSNE